MKTTEWTLNALNKVCAWAITLHSAFWLSEESPNEHTKHHHKAQWNDIALEFQIQVLEFRHNTFVITRSVPPTSNSFPTCNRYPFANILVSLFQSIRLETKYHTEGEKLELVKRQQ